jgi:hypothetical protein
MDDAAQTLKELEHKFWQSMVDNDTDAALALLEDPALMVSTHGSMMFDHEGYRRMAEHGAMVLTAFDLSDMDIVFPSESTAILSYNVKQVVKPRHKNEDFVQQMHDTSTWVRKNNRWKCVMHTETPAVTKANGSKA